VTTKKSLQQALKDILADDNLISKWDARAIRELILADGKISNDERKFVEQALQENNVDEHAFQLLSELLLREELKRR
jgi:uncharacterized membrane protein YebE (DUF533 family)